MNKIVLATLLLFSSISNAAFEEVGPGSVDFGVLSGVMHRSVVLKNTGLTKATLQPALTGPDAKWFSIALNRCVSIQSGKNCQVTISSRKAITPPERNISAALVWESLSVDIHGIVVDENAGTRASFDFAPNQPTLITFPASQKSVILPIDIVNNGTATGLPAIKVERALVVLNRCLLKVNPSKACSVYLQVANNAQSIYNAKISLTEENKTLEIPVQSSTAPPLTYTATQFSSYSPSEQDLQICQGKVESTRSITECTRDVDQSLMTDLSLCVDPTPKVMTDSPAGNRSTTRLASNLGILVERCEKGDQNLWSPVAVTCDQGNHDTGNLECTPDDVEPPQNITYAFNDTYKSGNLQYSKKTTETLSISVPANDATSMIVSNVAGCVGSAVPFSSAVQISINQSLPTTITYVKLFDSLNNGSECQALSINRDNLAPVISNAKILKEFSSSLSVTPSIEFSVLDAASGVKQVRARVLNSSNNSPVSGTWHAAVSGASLNEANLVAGSSYKIEIESTDNVGNVSTAMTGSWSIDQTAPTFSGVVTLASSSSNDLTKSPVVTFPAATDAGSGIDIYEARIVKAGDNSQVSPWAPLVSGSSIISSLSNGNYKVEVRSLDKVGNASSTLSSTSWAADNIVPAEADLTLAVTAGSSSLTQTPELQFNYADNSNGSGVSKIELKLVLSSDATVILKDWTEWLTASGSKAVLSPLSASLSTDVDYHFLVRITDRAGNVANLGTDKRLKFKITNYEVKIVYEGGYGSHYLYTNNAYAISCLNYLNGDATHRGSGNVSGIYRIQQPGKAVVDVYCDMEAWNGGWTIYPAAAYSNYSYVDWTSARTSYTEVMLYTFDSGTTQRYGRLTNLNGTNIDLWVDASSLFMRMLHPNYVGTGSTNGYVINGTARGFRNCDNNRNSYFNLTAGKYQRENGGDDSGAMSYWTWNSSWLFGYNRIPDQMKAGGGVFFGGCGAGHTSNYWPNRGYSWMAVGIK